MSGLIKAFQSIDGLKTLQFDHVIVRHSNMNQYPTFILMLIRSQELVKLIHWHPRMVHTLVSKAMYGLDS